MTTLLDHLSLVASPREKPRKEKMARSNKVGNVEHQVDSFPYFFHIYIFFIYIYLAGISEKLGLCEVSANHFHI